MKRRPKALVLLSGGIDSAACAHFMQRDSDVEGLFLDFGQDSAQQEKLAATKISSALQIPLQALRVSPMRQRGAGELVGRNSFLVSTALFASAGDQEMIVLGIHAGTPYYDCSAAFEQLMDKMVAEQTDGRVKFIAPFVDWTKAEVFAYFETTGLQANDTYSCETGDPRGCGRCASCRDRKVLGC